MIEASVQLHCHVFEAEKEIEDMICHFSKDDAALESNMYLITPGQKHLVNVKCH